tara:strand:- start:4805 stop:5680 length:876 start_codon:yes stop_codon:yes gene_type:complete
MTQKNKITEETSSRFVQTSRWKLHYNEAGAGHPVIFLHGTGPGATGWSNFHQNIAAISSKYRTILLDFPGWGKSEVFDCTGESRTSANVESVKLLMDELGLEKATLVGNSMGGAAVLEFMAKYPDRISHAITMGSGIFSLPNFYSPSGLSEGLRIIVQTYRDPSPANFKKLTEIMVVDQTLASDDLAEQRSSASLATPEHLANWLKWPMRHPEGPYGGVQELMTKLSASQTPTLLIHGRDDKTVPLETSLKTAPIIPNARTIVFNKCGHWAQLEHCDEFNRLVLGFIEQFT